MKRLILIFTIIITTASMAVAQEGGDDSFFTGTEDSTSNPLSIGGSLSVPFRLAPEWEDFKDSSWTIEPELETTLQFNSEYIDVITAVELTIDEDLNPDLQLDEAFIRLYMGQQDMELGWRKIEWGKGDENHIMDILNPIDYSNFIEDDLNDRKTGELMARFNFLMGDSGRLELVYIPWFTPDSYASSGGWTPYEVISRTATSETALTEYSQAYYIAATAAAGGDAGMGALLTAQRISEAEEDIIREEDTQNLYYSQVGIRFTHTIGPFDWGMAVQRSFMRDAIIEGVDMTGITAASDPHWDITYTPIVMVSEEMALVVGGFNIRHEGAYTFTEDWDGSDDSLRNHRVAWLLGVDRDLGFSHLNFNIQGTGTYILFTDNLEESDPDYDDEYYCDHNITAALSDKYFYEKLKVTVAGAWNIERGDFMIKAGAAFTVHDLLIIDLTYRMYEGEEDTVFGQFDSQDSLTLSCSVQF